MVYAIVESGGKQYKAVEGEFLEVDLLPEDVGKRKVFEKVLLIANGSETLVGSPYLADVSIGATISEHYKGEKIVVFKYRAKQRYRVKTGHRQMYTRLLVDAIQFPGKPNVEKEAEAPAAVVKKTRSKTAKSSKKGSQKTAAKPKMATVKKTSAKAASKPKPASAKSAPKSKTAASKAPTKSKAVAAKKTAKSKPSAEKSVKKTVKKTPKSKE